MAKHCTVHNVLAADIAPSSDPFLYSGAVIRDCPNTLHYSNL